MIHYRHYNSKTYDPETRYGIALYLHPKRKTLDIYFGSHVFVFWIGRVY